MFIADYFLFVFAYFLVCKIHYNFGIFESPIFVYRVFLVPFIATSFLYFLNIYKSLVRFINFQNILDLTKWLVLLSILDLSIFFFLEYKFFDGETFLDLEGLIIYWIFSILFILLIRLLANSFFSEQISSSRVVIYGAGAAGVQLANALRYSSEMNPIAFVDSDKSLHNSFVSGLKVISPKNLVKEIKRKRVEEILVAIPSATKSQIKSIVKSVEEYPIKIRVLPGVEELALGKVSVTELKEIEIEDLLGRERVTPDKELIKKNINRKVVLITGAGGSIGSELSRQTCIHKPKLVILLDSNEFALYSIEEELKLEHEELSIVAVLGNVTDEDRILSICKTFEVDTIYHSAAYKHVPIVEKSPFEGVINNIFGTLYTVQAAIKSNVETIVLISTDKAVRPTNIMGASKRFSELILQSISKEQNLANKTKMIMVRFGNVLGSSGSAVPLFQQQIEKGGPVTVTDPEIIRYFMTIPEAAELVIQAGALGKGGEIFVLDMGEPIRIVDLAKRMIRLSGMEVRDKENPEGDIEIVFTGLRPGEKLYEELLIGENVSSTRHSQIMKADEESVPWGVLDEHMKEILDAHKKSDHNKLREIFESTVSGYEPRDGIQDVLYLSNKS
tara:strand:+ start:39464 stop:41314 length:1851 start_codon:yes stop_codon:yes gene_type:complete